MDFLQWVPLLGALGVSGLIVGWAGAGKARREVRSGVLKALATAESSRWANTTPFSEFNAAIRELETTALVARVPRDAIRHYAVLAEASRRLSDDSYSELEGDEEMGAGGINGYYAGLVRDAAHIITQLAWSPLRTRVHLNRDLKSLLEQVADLQDDTDLLKQLANAQRVHGVLPGRLGNLKGIRSLPPQKKPELA